MKSFVRITLASIALLLLAAVFPRWGRAQTVPAPPCILGYTVGFFNGVANTEMDGFTSLNQVKASVEQVTGKPNDTYNNEDVNYQLFYNHTGTTVNATTFQDIAETFKQREDNVDPSGFFSANNLYMMWETLNGGGSTSYLAYADKSAGFGDFISTVTQDLILHLEGDISATLSNPPTASDFATQNAQLDTDASSGRKLLLIAHSQGNLFVDHAYDYIQPVVGSTRVKVVHVAPAAVNLRGDYLLSSNDAVINGLRVASGPTSVPANNIIIPFSLDEATGHSMGPTYLDDSPGRDNGRMQVEELELAGLAALTAPSGCNVTVTPGSPTLTVGTSQTFTATLVPAPTDPLLLTEYVWTVTGNAGGSFAGGALTTTTTSSTVGYSVPATATAGTMDTITVKVSASVTQGDLVNAVQLGTGAATVSVSNIKVTVAPVNGAINTGQSLVFNAVVTGAANPPGSYAWTTSGTYGSFKGAIFAGAFCTPSSSVTYQSNSPSTLPSGSSGTDTVSVKVYSDANCGVSSGNAALASASGAVKVTSVKDVTAWLGPWSNCTRPNSTYSYYVTLYGSPFPTFTNASGPPSYGADVLFIEQNRTDLSEAYGYITVVPTDLQTGYDSRFPSYNAAYNAGYPVFSIAGGVLTFSEPGTGVILSCMR